MNSYFKVVAAACLLVSTAVAIAPLTFQGAKIFDGDGNQFYIKGMAYQLTPDDPLVDTDQCTRDATLMATIGTNSIRVYHVDPDQDHRGCMSAFADQGIYLWLDLDTFNTSIYQANPYWSEPQFASFALVMDAFASFDNLAGFWIGNEAITDDTGSLTAPYLKAATADMKSYRDYKNYRSFGVGYSAADIAELRPMLQNYLSCGDDPSQSIDFFGLNSYEWCGSAATYETSGYSTLNDEAQGYNVPIFFSETGCNVGGERTFNDQAAILGPDMDDTWSGAIIYEWVQEVNSYGVISYAGSALSGTPTPVQPDFSNLATHWSTLTPTGTPSAQYQTSPSPPACPSSTPGGWLVNGDVPLPTLGMAVVTASDHTLVTVSYSSTSTSSSSSPTSSSTKPSSSSSASGSGGATTGTAATTTSSGMTGTMTSAASASAKSTGAAAVVKAEGATWGVMGSLLFVLGAIVA